MVRAKADVCHRSFVDVSGGTVEFLFWAEFKPKYQTLQPTTFSMNFDVAETSFQVRTTLSLVISCANLIQRIYLIKLVDPDFARFSS